MKKNFCSMKAGGTDKPDKRSPLLADWWQAGCLHPSDQRRFRASFKSWEATGWGYFLATSPCAGLHVKRCSCTCCRAAVWGFGASEAFQGELHTFGTLHRRSPRLHLRYVSWQVITFT